MILSVFIRNVFFKIFGGWEAVRKYSKEQLAAIFNKFDGKDRNNWKIKLSSLSPVEYKKSWNSKKRLCILSEIKHNLLVTEKMKQQAICVL